MDKGVLIIFNPRVSEKTPFGRLEEDFLDVSLGKLQQALKVAKDRGLRPLILGDLVLNPQERNLVLCLGKALREAGVAVIKTDTGQQLSFCERVLEATGVIEIIRAHDCVSLSIGSKSLAIAGSLRNFDSLSKLNAADNILIKDFAGCQEMLERHQAISKKSLLLMTGVSEGGVGYEGAVVSAKLPDLVRINARNENAQPGVIAWTFDDEPEFIEVKARKNVFEIDSDSLIYEKTADTEESRFTLLMKENEKLFEQEDKAVNTTEEMEKIDSLVSGMQMSDKCREIIHQLAESCAGDI